MERTRECDDWRLADYSGSLAPLIKGTAGCENVRPFLRNGTALREHRTARRRAAEHRLFIIVFNFHTGSRSIALHGCSAKWCGRQWCGESSRAFAAVAQGRS